MDIEKVSRQLANKDGGWVTRRDAAQELGTTAVEAIATLRKFAEDDDQDVKSEVQRALGLARGATEGDSAAIQGHAWTLEDLVKSVEKPGSRDIEQTGDEHRIIVQTGDSRKQTLIARPGKTKGGKDTIRLQTRCGAATEKALKWALRNNMHFAQCALALDGQDDEEQLVMVNSFIAGAVTPAEFKASVKEMAFYADWVEKHLTGGDEF